MIDFTVGQSIPAALHRISTGSGRSPAISRSATSIGTLDSAASATTVSSYLPSSAKAARAGSFMLPRPVQAEHDPLRRAIVARADPGADFLRHPRQDPMNFGLQCRRGRGQQPLMHDRGRALQQFAKHRRRNIRPQPDLLGKNAVALGALDQAKEAGLGNPRPPIGGDAAGDLPVAAAHQHVGHRLAEHLARRNRPQMRLAFGLGEIDQVDLLRAAAPV